jgi:GT2 family glycosyltransferase
VKVSFIIPLYNCLAHTRACLRTLRASLPRGLAHEIILIDDGSTDGTREWLAQECRDLVVILNEQNLGYAGANNRAAGQATGDLLVLLNNDLLFAPGWIEPMLALHARLSRPGLIGNMQFDARTGALDHCGICFDHKGKPAHDRSFPLPALLVPGHRPATAVTGACMLVSTELWRGLGGFDEGFRNGGEDIDLCLRAQQAGYINAVALRSNVRHHISASPGRKLHDEQNSRRLTQRWRQEIAMLSTRAWGWHFLSTRWGRSNEPLEIGAALGVLLYCLHLKSTPPAIVTKGIGEAIDHELARWDRLLGP